MAYFNYFVSGFVAGVLTIVVAILLAARRAYQQTRSAQTDAQPPLEQSVERSDSDLLTFWSTSDPMDVPPPEPVVTTHANESLIAAVFNTAQVCAYCGVDLETDGGIKCKRCTASKVCNVYCEWRHADTHGSYQFIRMCCPMCNYGPGCENSECICHVPDEAKKPASFFVTIIEGDPPSLLLFDEDADIFYATWKEVSFVVEPKNNRFKIMISDGVLIADNDILEARRHTERR